MDKVTILGTGSWGFALATLLSKNGYSISCWTIDEALAKEINTTHIHPRFPDVVSSPLITVTTSLQECLSGASMIVESVTAEGLRPVLQEVKSLGALSSPLVLTSKGIEQRTCLTLTEVACEVLGKKELIGALSGPSFADEVVRGLPTSVVATGYSPEVIQSIVETFTSDTFRVYPNSDVIGVGLGGALKNVIAIACGLCEGMKFGLSARAALITRGLHEIRKLAVARGADSRTLNGLAGLGDLCLTCSSPTSRNFKFGMLIAEGLSPEKAKEKVGMVVEGAYTAASATHLCRSMNVAMPIAETVYKIVYENLKPQDAVKLLMQRAVKEEHL